MGLLLGCFCFRFVLCYLKGFVIDVIWIDIFGLFTGWVVGCAVRIWCCVGFNCLYFRYLMVLFSGLDIAILIGFVEVLRGGFG